MNDVWPLVHAERAALIADLETLDPAAWETPSLCAAWSVHDVVAHVVATAKTTRLSFVAGLVAARFDFDADNARGVARERGATPQETLARLRAVADRTSTPPAPFDTRLVEAVLHGEDIRRPLGLTREYPLVAVERALRLQVRTSTSMGGAKQLVAGLRLVDEEAGLSIGDGPQVRGPALSLLLAVSGRAGAMADLDGEGATELATRCGVTPPVNPTG